MASRTKMTQDILRAGKVSEVEMVYKSKIADKPQLSSSEKMYQALMENWDMNQIDYRETSKLVLLNRAMKCLGIITLSEGGLNDTMVDVRMAMQAALLANASLIVLSHNHPSGLLTPSCADDKMTQQMKQAGDLLNIKLIDHIIVTKEGYFSYCDEDFIDKDVFLRITNRYDGNKYIKNFTCWNQLAVLMFGQLSNRESLRDVVLATQALAPKAYHLGFGKYVAKSTLADANAKRDYRIFEEFAYRVIAEAQRCRATDIFKLNGHVYAFDSTTIELCLESFKWALFRKNQRKGGIKVHTLYDVETQIPSFFHITPANVHDMKAMDKIPYEENSFYIFDRGYNDFKRLHNIENIGAYFVVRGKKNNAFKPMRWKRRFPPGSGIFSDAVGYMDGNLTMGKYPDKIRRVLYHDDEQNRNFIFFTNALTIKPEMVALLYKNRWQIELFFKWLKQHLKIKKFWGNTENAVRIQIYAAITAYCMMAIVQKKMGIKRSIYEMLQIVSISLTETTPLKNLFAEPNYNIVNELNGSSEPTLFDC